MEKPEGRDFVWNENLSCPCCSKVLSSRKGLEKHYRIHVGHKRFLCACGKAFLESYGLTRHRRGCPQAYFIPP